MRSGKETRPGGDGSGGRDDGVEWIVPGRRHGLGGTGRGGTHRG
jgi:hypothetical protein